MHHCFYGLEQVAIDLGRCGSECQTPWFRIAAPSPFERDAELSDPLHTGVTERVVIKALARADQVVGLRIDVQLTRLTFDCADRRHYQRPVELTPDLCDLLDLFGQSAAKDPEHTPCVERWLTRRELNDTISALAVERDGWALLKEAVHAELGGHEDGRLDCHRRQDESPGREFHFLWNGLVLSLVENLKGAAHKRSAPAAHCQLPFVVRARPPRDIRTSSREALAIGRIH